MAWYDIFLDDPKKGFSLGNLNTLTKLGASGLSIYGLARLLNKDDELSDFIGTGGGGAPPVGYQGGIPKYTAERTALPIADTNLQNAQLQDWATQYGLDPTSTLQNAQSAMQSGIGFGQLMDYNAQRNKPYTPKDAYPTRRPGSAGRRYFSDVVFTPVPPDTTVAAAQGGLMSLPHAKGYYLGGRTDGMADRIPARINNQQPAALSDGEFVVPADVVSHLGNGNSNAGADVLYSMMDKVRVDRTGRKSQGRQIDPYKYIPTR